MKNLKINTKVSQQKIVEAKQNERANELKKNEAPL